MTTTQGEHAQPEALRPEMLDDLIETFRTAGLGRYNLMRVELPRHQWAQLAAELCRHATPAQPAAPQGGAYAELPEPPRAYAGKERGAWEHGFNAERASHGQVPAGAPVWQGRWAWVPLEPSTAMLVAGNHGQPGNFSALKVWQDMLDALQRSHDYTRPVDPPTPTAQPAPAATPQADSQPVPVRDYPPLPEQVAWRDAVEHCDLYWRPVVQEHNDLEPLFTDTQMRAYVDADRAARAPAGSVTAPAADLQEDQTQPWYDLAWKHGAQRHTSFDGDELTELSFSPAQFDAFCAELAPAAGVVAGPGWRVVPAEPTEAMFTRFSQQIEEGVVYVGGFLQAYRCMLDAAPTPAAQGDA